MRSRIEPELRDAFMAIFRSQDVPAAQVIRTFIKGYVCQFQGATDIPAKPRKKQAKPTTSTE